MSCANLDSVGDVGSRVEISTDKGVPAAGSWSHPERHSSFYEETSVGLKAQMGILWKRETIEKVGREHGLPPSFGPHPVACDVWHIGAFDMGSEARIQTIKGTLMSSPRPDGASGPVLSRTVLETGGVSTDEFRIEHVGTETVTVEAGTIETEHFRFLLGEESIPEDIWCLPGDLIIVKVRFDVMATTYELVELER